MTAACPRTPAPSASSAAGDEQALPARLAQNPPQALPLRDPRAAHVRHVLVHLPPPGPDGVVRSGWRTLLLRLLACPQLAPTWLDDTPADATPAATGAAQLALGLTWRGLQMDDELRPHVRQLLSQLAPALRQGAAPRAARRLGDTGASAAQHWDPAFAHDRVLGCITVLGPSAAAVDGPVQALRDLVAQQDALARPLLHVIDGAQLPPPPGQQGQWVHFGYRDGLSRVRLRGLSRAQGDAAAAAQPAPVAAGEVLLGLPRENGDNPWQLAGQPPLVRTLFRHGSFGALRQIEQDVAAFEAFVQQAAEQARAQWPADLPHPTDWPGWVKAKLCGRWPDGRLLDEHGQAVPADPAALPPQIDSGPDTSGSRCPFGAHVRRLNPRPTQDPERNLVHARLRVLVRRGLPYGPANWAGTADGQARGLLGHFFCSSLEEQFEHLLGAWAEGRPLGLPDRGDVADPLIGHHDDPGAAFEVPLPGGRPSLWLRGLRRFVRTRGTLYAFYPARDGLHALLSGRDLVGPDDEERRP